MVVHRTESETFHIGGAFQRVGGGMISEAQMDAFMDRFIDLVEEHGLGFGGGWGLDPLTDEEWAAQELSEAALNLRNAISTFEEHGGLDLNWKDAALATLRQLEQLG